MFVIAALLASTAAPMPYVQPTEFACYASKNERGNKTIVITNKTKSKLPEKGLRRVKCAENIRWTPEDAKRQCNFLRHYDAEATVAYKELHGILPEEVCQEGKRAAGIPEETKKAEQ